MYFEHLIQKNLNLRTGTTHAAHGKKIMVLELIISYQPQAQQIE